MMFLKSISTFSGLAVILLVSACSSHIPPEIKQPVEGSPGVAEVREHSDGYQSRKVRWGGIILEIENKENASELTIMALSLNENGKPQDSDQSPGRFIAVVDKFVEPLVFSPERVITVTGKILKTETRKVGEFPYDYPVVEVEHYYLWPPEPEQDYDPYPFYPWYDPFYSPWHYPYYYPHRHPYY